MSGTASDPIVAELTAPGAPFEIQVLAINGVECRVFFRQPQTLVEVYRKAAVHNDRVLVVDEGQGTTYRDLFRQAGALAKTLSGAYGLRKGAHIGIAMQNSTEWMVAFVAITALGGVAVLLNSRSAPDELGQAIVEADCQLVFADARCVERLAQLQHKLSVPVIVTSAAVMPGAASTFARATAGWQSVDGLECVDVAGEDLAVLMFTAGTTGAPKAAMLTHRNIAAGLANSNFASATSFAAFAKRAGPQMAAMVAKMQQTLLMIAPLFHVSGCHNGFLRALDGGAKLVLMRRWSAADAPALIAAERVQQIAAVPTMLWDLLSAPDFDKRKLASVMLIGVGGAPLPPNLLREVQRLMPQAIFAVGYGMTETNGSVATASGEAFSDVPDAVGKVLPTVDLKLMRDDGSEAGIGESGEIVVRGTVVMQGYFKRLDETEKTLSGGWLRTGDVGRFDEHGRLYIVDRKKHMVISGGENIYCAEVERAFSELPEVREIVAFGLPDERMGEKVAVVIVHHSDQTLEAEVLKDRIAATLAGYKHPRVFFFRNESLPRTGAGKIDRRAVIEELRARYRGDAAQLTV